MANQFKNKVIYNGTVLIDLTADTVTADKILAKYTAHDKAVTSSQVLAITTLTPRTLLLVLPKF